MSLQPNPKILTDQTGIVYLVESVRNLRVDAGLEKAYTFDATLIIDTTKAKQTNSPFLSKLQPVGVTDVPIARKMLEVLKKEYNMDSITPDLLEAFKDSKDKDSETPPEDLLRTAIRKLVVENGRLDTIMLLEDIAYEMEGE